LLNLWLSPRKHILSIVHSIPVEHAHSTVKEPCPEAMCLAPPHGGGSGLTFTQSPLEPVLLQDSFGTGRE